MRKGQAIIKNTFKLLKEDYQQNSEQSKSSLSVKFGIDRKTARKYIHLINNNQEIPTPKKDKYLEIEKYYETIHKKIENGCSATSVYKFLEDKFEIKFSYQYFTKYLRDKGIETRQKQKSTPIVTYETLPGEEGQIDWKENFSLYDRFGRKITFNVFLFKLSYSRKCSMFITLDKRQDTVMKCLLDTEKELGGLPKKIICDNMKTVIYQPNNGSRNSYVINSKFKEFSKDIGVKIYPCQAYRPQTKGKVEALAKLPDRLKAYNYEFDTIDELNKIIKTIQDEYNSSINHSTGLIPNTLWLKNEFELLNARKINENIVRKYKTQTVERTVKNTSLVTFMSNSYSVPAKYIGKTVYLSPNDQILIIYDEYNQVIAEHKILDKQIKYQKLYKEQHMFELYKAQFGEKDMTQVVKNSLKALDLFLKTKEEEINGQD